MIAILLGACTTPTPTPPPPAEATPPEPLPWVDTGIYRPPDTGTVALGDDIPDNYLTIEHTGVWNRSGTPYDTLVGTFSTRELLDGYVPDTADTGDLLDCEVSYILTATPADVPATCPGCNAPWRITFTYDAASPTTTAACYDAELPTDGEEWRMALNPSQGIIYFDYYFTGVWMPWWDATVTGDQVDFSWTGQLAVAAPEED